MEYLVIFTTGYLDDIDSIAKELKADVLLLDENGNYYNPQFITIERIKGEFSKEKICYLEDNLVILHKVTKDTIIESIPELHKWAFYRRWVPLSINELEKYFYPKDDWMIFKVFIDQK